MNLFDFLFPPVCPHCGTHVQQQGDWCDACIEDVLHVRQVPSKLLSSLDSAWILADYRGGIKSMIYDVKFNEKKDQSYMLYRLGQDVLSRLIFPLGQFLSKDETRQLAREKHLDNAEKKDSQEICFISPDESYIQYIQALGYSSKPGNFIDKNGKVLGTHQGILHYTIGQRKGLGVALGKPAFVTDIDCSRNEIVLGDNEDLFENEVISRDNCFVSGTLEDYNGKQVLAKVRYSAQPSEAVIHVDGDRIHTVFLQKQRAITPGQSIVFYDGDKLLGGGFIEKNLSV